MALGLYIVTILSGIIFKKSKIVTLFIFFIMFILTAYCYNNADYESYALDYSYDYFENDISRYIGYDYITHVAKDSGLLFEEYRIIFYLFVLGILFIALSMITDKINIVLSFILISFFGIEAIQMKSFLADVISFLAIVIYIRGKSSQQDNHVSINTCVAIILFFIASTIHFAAIYYLATFLILLLFKRKKNYHKYLLIISLIFVMILVSSGIGGILNYVIMIGLSSESGIGYLSNWGDSTTHFGFIITYFLVGIVYYFLFLEYYQKKINLRFFRHMDFVKNEIMEYVFTICIMLPLLYINVTFDRIFRLYFLLIFVYLSRYPLDYKHFTFHEITMFGIVLFICIYEFFLDIYPSLDGTIGAILTNNLIFY